MEMQQRLMRLQNLLLLTLALILSLAITGCGGKKTEGPAIYEIQKAVLDAAPNLPEMITVNSNEEAAKDNFAYLSEMDYKYVDAYFLSYSSTGLADEIAVIRLNNTDYMGEAIDSLEKHAAGRVALYEQYDPTQTKRAEDAVIYSSNNCAVLIIADDAIQIQKALENLI